MSKRKDISDPATDRLVLDGSIALAWCFTDEWNEYSQSVLDALDTLTAVVPQLWRLEVANVLLVGERRKRSTQADTIQWTSFLAAFPIVIDDETASHAWQETANLARTHHLSAYDAAYLELAMRLNLPLATLDKQLKAAALTVGVPLFGVH